MGYELALSFSIKKRTENIYIWVGDNISKSRNPEQSAKFWLVGCLKL